MEFLVNPAMNQATPKSCNCNCNINFGDTKNDVCFTKICGTKCYTKTICRPTSSQKVSEG